MSPSRANGQQRDWAPGRFGFNLIGFASANLGLGVAFRNTASILLKARIPFCVIDVDPGGGRTGFDMSLAPYFHRANVPLPYPVNIFHMNPPEVAQILSGPNRDLFEFDSKMNVCVPFWELPMLPPSWIVVLNSMDMVLAPSQFMRHALVTQLNGVPCRYYRQGLESIRRADPDRSRWNIPGDKVVFLYAFDIASDMVRKNPLGVMESFSRSELLKRDAVLVIKSNNKDMNNRAAELAHSLKHFESNSPNLRVINEALSYPDLLSLYSSADVFVSLHRGEGLGLGMMEAMALEKAVIATGWSGNMDFMDDGNSCLVDYKLVPVTSDSDYFKGLEGVVQAWASPDLENAKEWMERLASDAGFRKTIGQNAGKSIRKFIEESWKGEVFDSMKAFYENAVRMRYPGGAPAPDAGAGSGFSVVLQNRRDMLLLPGGDAVVLEEIRKQLDVKGISNRLSLSETETFRPNELVQLTNITRSQDTYEQLQNARLQCNATVLIPLYEDLERYLVHAIKLEMVLVRLAEQGTILPLEDIVRIPGKFDLPGDPFQSPEFTKFGIGNADLQGKILSGVDHILTSGKCETDLLRSRFNFTGTISELHYGINPEVGEADGRPFKEKYGLKDFVLCVGRIETRKNQLTLIEIFRSLPHIQLVLIGFFSNRYFESAVRKHAPKNVHFLDRVSQAELHSAYAAARVHVLPSWYELPGLVSLEAAAAGARIVSTSWGTARDYFHDRIAYCEPDRPETIRQAILRQFDSDRDPSLREYVLENFTWKKTAENLAECYRGLAARQKADGGRAA